MAQNDAMLNEGKYTAADVRAFIRSLKFGPDGSKVSYIVDDEGHKTAVDDINDDTLVTAYRSTLLKPGQISRF